MRPNSMLPTTRGAQVGACALMLSIPVATVAVGPEALARDMGITRSPQTGTLSPAPAQLKSEASFKLAAHSIKHLGGGSIDVTGSLLPAVADRTVELQARDGGRWHTVADAATGPQGRFDVRYDPGGTGRQALRVRFAGDAVSSATQSAAGTVTTYKQSGASWYDDGGGSTACGFSAHYGVANRTLPCGTKVTFNYHGATVTATVDDRGPFVDGRDWDLNQGTAQALGFDGVDTVWASS